MGLLDAFLTCLLMIGGCVHLLYNSSWKFLELATGQLLSGQQVRYRKCRGVQLIHHPSIFRVRPAL
jgi:hypothetical protein